VDLHRAAGAPGRQPRAADRFGAGAAYPLPRRAGRAGEARLPAPAPALIRHRDVEPRHGRGHAEPDPGPLLAGDDPADLCPPDGWRSAAPCSGRWPRTISDRSAALNNSPVDACFIVADTGELSTLDEALLRG